MRFNPRKALEALLNGEFDNPDLVKYGELSDDQQTDIDILNEMIDEENAEAHHTKPYAPRFEREDPETRYYRGYATYLERDSDHGEDY